MRGHLFHQVDIAFVRRMNVQRGRAQPRVASLFEDHRLLDVRQTHAAHLARRMRRQQAGSTCARNQFIAQLLVRAMAVLPRIVLERDHLFGDEGTDALAQRHEFGGHSKIHLVLPFLVITLVDA